MSLGSWFGAGARGLAILGVFLATAEAFVRADDALTWGAPLLSPYTHDRLLLQDSRGFRGRPQYRYQKWRMNNLGFRGPDLAVFAAPGKIRIAIVGASETFGLYESEGDEYPARMQAVLESLAPGRFEVVNASLPGMTVSAMGPYFERAILPLRPHLLLVYPTPSFYLWTTSLPLDYAPPRFGGAPDSVRIGPWAIESDAVASRLAGKARDVLKELVPDFVVTAVRESGLRRRRAAHEPGWVWQAVPEDRMALFRSHLARLVDTVRAAGVRVALVTHANRVAGSSSRIEGSDRRLLINLIAVECPRATPEVLAAVDSVANEVIRQVGRERGAVVLELEGRVPSNAEYFADYAHFTNLGADHVARILASETMRLVTVSTLPSPTPAPRP
jgi:hypothetical protein